MADVTVTDNNNNGDENKEHDTARDEQEVLDAGRRDFIFLTAGAMGAVGAACVAWPLINSMNPAADTLALATTEVDIGAMQPGQAITVTWRGKPVFIRRRTQTEIEEARNVDISELPDPQPDAERVDPDHEEFLIVVGVCTHLGCVPNGQKPADDKGEYGGWFCPCHGSHYDTSGRIRKGPAPANLLVPEFAFISDTRVRLG